MAKAGAKKKAANGYKLAEIVPAGEVLEDVRQKKWRLGEAVGQGGFGRIYSAQDASSSGSSYPYVIKIEPHANGPLFVEMQFYIRNAKPEDVNAFKQEKKLKTFGMPLYLGSGSHEFKGEKYRFVVTEHFGTDLWKIFLENNEVFPLSTVFKIAVQVLDVLEYIHSRGYVHADIKGANILMGKTKETKNKQVYLVDFGLATKYSNDKEYKPDPKKAHDGTIEYLSRDAHKGVQTRRGDLEILAYNIIQWLGCKLPWMNMLKNPKDVQESKENYMKEIPKFIKMCFGKRTPPGPIVDYLNYITSLEFNIEPDYKYIRKIFVSGIGAGDSLDKPFQFTSKKQTPVKRKLEAKATSSPRKKAAKTKAKKEPEPSEDEKENDLDSIEENHHEEANETDRSRKGRARNIIDYKEDSEENAPAPRRKAAKTKPIKEPEPSEDEKENDLDSIEDNHHEEANEANTSRKGRARNITDYKEDSEENASAPQRKATKTKPEKEAEPSEDEKDNDMDSSEENHHEEANEADTSRKGRARNRINYREDSDDDSKKSKKRAVKKNKARVSEELHVTGDNLEGFNDAMKEVVQKKKQKTSKKKKTEETKESDDDDMDGYNEEMKKIAMKRKASKKTKPAKVGTPSKSSKRNRIEVTNGDVSDAE